jgi:hypothetical protein
VNPAVIGIRSSSPERHWEDEPVIVDARIKYPIRTIGSAGRHAVIVGGPSPINDITDLDGDRARDEVGPALSHANVRRSRRSKDRQQDQKKERQSEIHFEGFVAARLFAPQANTEHTCRN